VGDAVADREDLADLGNFGLLAEILDLVFEDCGISAARMSISGPLSWHA